MLHLHKEWSVSFAGCGFMGIYYVGAVSCVLERFPALLRDASAVCGASAGALMAAVVTLGLPLERCCADLMRVAQRARSRRLGPLHPAFDLLREVRDSLRLRLPEDAHVRASGRLCVSLTRVSDGKNVLVSEFGSREELVQALVCSCFVPLYCGVIPPTYRGVHYVDGAISDNLPRCHRSNTVTFSPYAGENDVCPRPRSLWFHQVRFSNVSIQLNSENLYRVTSTFFPPEPEAIAGICQSGYLDALRFLQEHGLISSDGPGSTVAGAACCERATRGEAEQRGTEHAWLNPQVIAQLPANVQKVLCEACREAQGLVSSRGSSSSRSLAQRLTGWIPDVPKDVSWLYGMLQHVYKAWQDEDEDEDSEKPLRRCTSLPLGLNL
ncbi:patatin-like phospholipase domain-containing protein 2 isoform X2 [Betta splendens]|uniref:triacylglycerol lipase n=1 Tax=Betta splendens TaxID=158456 RepID=A0A9W2XVH5_BETSP|nr:patatin-like phospholipase domain-containing protein 2 isoform X2 [Betta splendens]